jgi:hypothetical protein
MRQKDGAPLHRLPRPQALHSNRSGKNLIKKSLFRKFVGKNIYNQ